MILFVKMVILYVKMVILCLKIGLLEMILTTTLILFTHSILSGCDIYIYIWLRKTNTQNMSYCLWCLFPAEYVYTAESLLDSLASCQFILNWHTAQPFKACWSFFIFYFSYSSLPLKGGVQWMIHKYNVSFDARVYVFLLSLVAKLKAEFCILLYNTYLPFSCYERVDLVSILTETKIKGSVWIV